MIIILPKIYVGGCHSSFDINNLTEFYGGSNQIIQSISDNLPSYEKTFEDEDEKLWGNNKWLKLGFMD